MSAKKLFNTARKTPQELGQELITECWNNVPFLPRIQALLAAGAGTEEKDQNGNTALILAVSLRKTEIVRALLEAGAGAAIDEANSTGCTALILAADRGDTKTLQVLLKAGAAIDQKNMNGDTALMRAALWGHVCALQALLDVGAEVDEKNRWDETALMRAKLHDRHEALQLLEAEEKKREEAKLHAFLKNPVTARDVVVRPVVFKRKGAP